MVNIGSLTLKDEEFLDDFVESFEARRVIYTEDLLKKHVNSPLKIYVKTSDIRFCPAGDYRLIPCKAELFNPSTDFQSKIEIDCVVAFGKWNLFWDIKEDRFNIFDYFPRFFSQMGKGIGLITFQNGIQNKFENLKEMGVSIRDAIPFPYKPLCIGFYNETCGSLEDASIWGMKQDLFRLMNPWLLNPRSILAIRQLICTLANEQIGMPGSVSNFSHTHPFLKQNSALQSRSNFSLTEHLLPANVRWVHIAHSEGGLLAKKATTPVSKHLYGLPEKAQRFIQNHLIVSTFGAVKPVPNITLGTINTYSQYDVTMHLIAKHLEEKHAHIPDEKILKEMCSKQYAAVSSKAALFPRVYTRKNTTVTIIASLLAKENVPLIEGDHDFQGDTYKAALPENIKALANKYNMLWTS